VARLTQVGSDAQVLLDQVRDRFGNEGPEQAQVLRRLLLQHFLIDGLR